MHLWILTASPLQSHSTPQRFWDSVTKRISIGVIMSMKIITLHYRWTLQIKAALVNRKLRREADVVCVTSQDGCSRSSASSLMLSWSQHKPLWMLSVSHERFHVPRQRSHTCSLSLHFTFILSSLALYFPVLLLIPFYLSSKYKLNSNKSFSLLAKSSYSLYCFILSLQLDFIFPYQEHSCTASGL